MSEESKDEPVTASQVINWSLTIFAAICVPLVGLAVKASDTKTQTDMAAIIEDQRLFAIEQDRWNSGQDITIANMAAAREALALELAKTMAELRALEASTGQSAEMFERVRQDRNAQVADLARKIEALADRVVDLEVLIHGVDGDTKKPK